MLLAATWKAEDWLEPLIVEAKANLFGIKVAMDFGFRDVVVESDCLHFINAISWLTFDISMNDS